MAAKPPHAYNRPAPATITLNHGYEPASPGLVYVVSGCGFEPGTAHIVEEATYRPPAYLDPYLDPSWEQFWGQTAQVEYDVPVDSGGCIIPYWTQEWGIGDHTINAYQGRG